MSVNLHLRRLLGESTIYGLANALTRLTSVFLIPVYTRAFSPNEYGVVALLTSLLALFATFLVLGLDNASARWFYDRDESDYRRTVIASWFYCQFSVSIVAAFVLYLLSTTVSRLLFGTGSHALLIELVAASLPLLTFFKIGGNLLRYQRRAVASSIFSFTEAVVTIGLIIYFVVKLKHGLEGVYTARLAGAVLIAIVGYSFLRIWIQPRDFSWTKLREMLRFSLPLVPAGIAIWVRLSSDRFILQMFHDQAEVGLYSVAFQVASAAGLFTTAFGFAYGPFAFSILNESSARQTYARAFEIYSAVGIILVTLLSLFAKPIFYLITTPDYFEAVNCVAPLAFSFIIYGGLSIASLGPSIVKKSGPVATAIIISAIVSLGLNFLLVPSYGRIAAATANLVASLAAVVYLFVISQREYRIPYRFRPVVALGLISASIIVLGVNVELAGVNRYLMNVLLWLIAIAAVFVLRLIKFSELKILFIRSSGGRSGAANED